VVSRSGPKKLGCYKCHECGDELTTSTFGMERHLESHETNSAIRIYKSKKHGTYHPHEQYKSGGTCSRANGVVLNHFHIGSQKIERGMKWKCAHCNFEEEWQSNSTGQKGSRVIEKIEKHVSYFETHGICEKLNSENGRRNAAGGVVASGGVNGASVAGAHQQRPLLI
jgi:hypothetical protein